MPAMRAEKRFETSILFRQESCKVLKGTLTGAEVNNAPGVVRCGIFRLELDAILLCQQ
jgi:hypothetical protein